MFTCISINKDANAYKTNENVTNTRKNVTNAPLSKFLVNVINPHEPDVMPNAQHTETTS